jgi:hypothetical protein
VAIEYMTFRGHTIPSTKACVIRALERFERNLENDLEFQNDIFNAAEELIIDSEYYDDKLAGIHLLTMVLMEHHVQCRKQYQKQKQRDWSSIQSPPLFVVDPEMQKRSIFANEVQVVEQMQSLFFQPNHMDAKIFVDLLADDFFRKLQYHSYQDFAILQSLFAWAETPPRIHNDPRRTPYFTDYAIFQRAIPILTCYEAVKRNALPFSYSSSSSSSSNPTTSWNHPHPQTSHNKKKLGDLLLEACSHNLTMATHERYPSLIVGRILRYVLLHHPKLGQAFLEQHVSYMRPKGLTYAMAEWKVSTTVKDEMMQQCHGGRYVHQSFVQGGKMITSKRQSRKEQRRKKGADLDW